MFLRIVEHSGADAILATGALEHVYIDAALASAPESFVVGEVGKRHGMIAQLGVHHHNRYNAYCLADDIMEPYRPYVDRMVCDMIESDGSMILTPEVKKAFLSIPVLDVDIDGHRSPLMVAVSTTTASLAKCFTGESRKVIYPEM